MRSSFKKIVFFAVFFCFSALFAAEDYSFELYTMSGKLLSTSEIMRNPAAKYLIVDFFALICEPCKKSLPKWEQFYAENKAKGFEFLLVALPSKGDRKKVEKDLKDYFKQNRYNFSIAFDKYSVIGKKFRAVEANGNVKLPMIFVLDKAGTILFKAESYDEAMTKIQNLK